MTTLSAHRRPCTWRFFEEGNTTQLNTDFVYAAELLLHEVGRLRLLLCSSHMHACMSKLLGAASRVSGASSLPFLVCCAVLCLCFRCC